LLLGYTSSASVLDRSTSNWIESQIKQK